MPLEVETTNFLQTAGTPYIYVGLESTPKVAGNTVELAIGGRRITITFATTPDPEKFEVRPYTNSGTFASFVSDMNALPIVGDLYTFGGSYGSPAILSFTLNDVDKRDELLTAVTWSNASWSVNVQGAANVYRPNYRLLANVYRQEDNTDRRSTTLLHQLDAIPDKTTNRVLMDLKSAFAELRPDVPSAANETGINTCTEAHTHYWVELAERYGESPITYTREMLGYDDNYPGVIGGGMPWNTWDADTVNDDYHTGVRKFFTNKVQIVTRTNMPQWLYFYHDDVANSIEIAVVVTFTDNTTDSFTDGPYVKSEGMQRVAVGYTQLYIPGNVTIPAGHMVKHYTVKVQVVSAAAITETKTIVVDNVAADETYLVYENLWMGLDTLHCRGEVMRGITAETNAAEGVDLTEYAANNGPLQQYGTRGIDRMTVNTGFLYADELEHLRELVLADNIWLVEGTQLRRVTLDRNAFETMYGNTPPDTGIALSLTLGNYR